MKHRLPKSWRLGAGYYGSQIDFYLLIALILSTYVGANLVSVLSHHGSEFYGWRANIAGAVISATAAVGFVLFNRGPKVGRYGPIPLLKALLRLVLPFVAIGIFMGLQYGQTTAESVQKVVGWKSNVVIVPAVGTLYGGLWSVVRAYVRSLVARRLGKERRAGVLPSSVWTLLRRR